MVGKARTAAVDLTPLKENSHEYAFFRLVQILHKLEGVDEEKLAEFDPRNEVVQFSAHTSLGFPASDVASFDILDEDDSNYLYQVTANFLGLHGVDSPLPAYYLEEVAQSAPEDAVRKHFLDFFNHRMLSLLYQILRKYRYYIRFVRQAEDRYSDRIFSLIGLTSREMRLVKKGFGNRERNKSGKDIHWSKLLTYAGFLSSRSRSPQIVAGIIAHTFDLPDAYIETFVFRRVVIREEQRFYMGRTNSQLGCSAVLGEKVPDYSGKFRVVIGGLTLDRFNDFLPTGKHYDALLKLLEFMLKDHHAYDLKLSIISEKAPPITLKREAVNRLGWSSFLGENTEESQRNVIIQVRT